MGKDNCHDAQPGDLIEIDRKFYQHWALYIGDGYVIHIAPEDEELPSWLANFAFIFAGKAKVKKQLLKEVAGNDNWSVNNKYDGSHTPCKVDKIIQRAKEWIDRPRSYDVLTNNCEHFVTELRYGEGVSEQAIKIILRIVAAVGVYCLAVLAHFIVMFLRRKSFSI